VRAVCVAKPFGAVLACCQARGPWTSRSEAVWAEGRVQHILTTGIAVFRLLQVPYGAIAGGAVIRTRITLQSPRILGAVILPQNCLHGIIRIIRLTGRHGTSERLEGDVLFPSRQFLVMDLVSVVLVAIGVSMGSPVPGDGFLGGRAVRIGLCGSEIVEVAGLAEFGDASQAVPAQVTIGDVFARSKRYVPLIRPRRVVGKLARVPVALIERLVSVWI